LLENIDLIRNGHADWSATSTGLDPQHTKVILKISTKDNTISYDYFFREDSTGYRLIPRFWMYLNNLSVVRTKYFDVFYRNESQLNDLAVFDLDRVVETIASTFGVPDENLRSLNSGGWNISMQRQKTK